MHWVCSRAFARIRDAEYIGYYVVGYIELTSLRVVEKLIREFIIGD